MTKRIVVTAEIEAKANNTLAALAQKEPQRNKPKSASAYLREHATEIRALMRKGYTAQDIIESLAGAGLSITSATLQRAIAGAAKKKTKNRMANDGSKNVAATKKETDERMASEPGQRRTDKSKFVDYKIPKDI